MEQRNEITGIDNHRSNYHTNLFFYGIVYACYSVNVSFHFKHIAEALAADNVSSICADFLTEAGDMDVDGAVGDDDASPDSVHELLAGEDISTILQQEDEQVELSTCEVDGLAVDADGLAVEADLETAEGEKTLAEAGFDYVHHIVAETFAVGDDVGVKRAYGVGVGMAVDVAQALCLEAVSQVVDVALDIL